MSNSSSNLIKLFEELYYSKLTDKIAEDIKENTNNIIRKQLPEIYYKRTKRDDRLLELIRN